MGTVYSVIGYHWVTCLILFWSVYFHLEDSLSQYSKCVLGCATKQEELFIQVSLTIWEIGHVKQYDNIKNVFALKCFVLDIVHVLT